MHASINEFTNLTAHLLSKKTPLYFSYSIFSPVFQVMSKFAHENIAQYYTAFVVKLELWVVMRLYGGGSVLDVMKHILKTVCCYDFEDT